jgi:hypothetical protein
MSQLARVVGLDQHEAGATAGQVVLAPAQVFDACQFCLELRGQGVAVEVLAGTLGAVGVGRVLEPASQAHGYGPGDMSGSTWRDPIHSPASKLPP